MSNQQQIFAHMTLWFSWCGKAVYSGPRVCNIVSENPRIREKTRRKQEQGMGGLRF